MRCIRCALTLAMGLITASGCTGESVRAVIPAWHPANPTAAESPFVVPPDPFAREAMPPPAASEKPPSHRHGEHPGAMDGGMRMDEMPSGPMEHGGHGMPDSLEKEEGQ